MTSLADRLQIDFGLIHREKHYKTPPESLDATSGNGTTPATAKLEPTDIRITLVGDVKDRICFLVDDVLDSPFSFIDAAQHLRACEASSVYVVATHGILSGDAIHHLEACAAIDEVIVTNSYPIPEGKWQASSKLRVIDISGVLAEAIRRTHNGESISYLFHTAL